MTSRGISRTSARQGSSAAGHQGIEWVNRLAGLVAEAPEVDVAYLTADQVGELLQASPKSVYRWAKQDPSMPMLRIGATIRFPKERLLAWLRVREQGQGRPRTRHQVLASAKPAPPQEARGA
jgi:excisionase family DNA binding protein